MSRARGCGSPPPESVVADGVSADLSAANDDANPIGRTFRASSAFVIGSLAPELGRSTRGVFLVGSAQVSVTALRIGRAARRGAVPDWVGARADGARATVEVPRAPSDADAIARILVRAVAVRRSSTVGVGRALLGAARRRAREVRAGQLRRAIHDLRTVRPAPGGRAAVLVASRQRRGLVARDRRAASAPRVFRRPASGRNCGEQNDSQRAHRQSVGKRRHREPSSRSEAGSGMIRYHASGSRALATAPGADRR